MVGSLLLPGKGIRLSEDLCPNAWFPCLMMYWSSCFVFVDCWFVESFVSAVMCGCSYWCEFMLACLHWQRVLAG